MLINTLDITALDRTGTTNIDARKTGISSALCGNKGTCRLSTIDIAKSHTPVAMRRSPGVISIVAHSSVRHTTTRAVGSMLGLTANISIHRHNNFNIRASVSVGNKAFSRVAVLLGNIGVSGPRANRGTSSFPMTLTSVSRVRILRKTTSHMFKASTFGNTVGVIAGGTGGSKMSTGMRNKDFKDFKTRKHIRATFRANG